MSHDYDDTLRHFKPEFGNMRHRRVIDIMTKIRAVERRITLAEKRGQNANAAKKKLEELKKNVVTILNHNPHAAS